MHLCEWIRMLHSTITTHTHTDASTCRLVHTALSEVVRTLVDIMWHDDLKLWGLAKMCAQWWFQGKWFHKNIERQYAHTQTHTHRCGRVRKTSRARERERDAAIPHSAPTQTAPRVSVEPPNRNRLHYFYRKTIFSPFLPLYWRQPQFGHTETVRAAVLSKYKEQYAQHPCPRRAGPTSLRRDAGDWWQAATAQIIGILGDYQAAGGWSVLALSVLEITGCHRPTRGTASQTRGPRGPTGGQQLHRNSWGPESSQE